MSTGSQNDEALVAVIGLGYVGLPLAVEFGKKRPVLGFDVNVDRVSELMSGMDRTNEVAPEELLEASGLSLSSDPRDLSDAAYYIVTVPTPIDAAKRPDLRPLEAASRTVGEHLSPGDTVIFESTVYPGATEEVCVPILEAQSGLSLNSDFFVGYSPERINPGDREHRLPSILKVTSGSTAEAAEDIDLLYRQIITAGTHKASSIRVAEAAKVIENTQRDVNIALINELSILFSRLGIDTHEVLAAAGTKWNFLPFRPGLVGGHCIGVDPYYLTHKAQEVGHHPDMILAGRRTNDAMGAHVADRVVLLMAQRGINVGSANVLLLGLAFKENCPDVRNTRAVDIVARLRDYNIDVDIADPWVDPAAAIREYDITLIETSEALKKRYDAVILAVAHDEFVGLLPDLRETCGDESVVFDVKGVWDPRSIDGRL